MFSILVFVTEEHVLHADFTLTLYVDVMVMS